MRTIKKMRRQTRLLTTSKLSVEAAFDTAFWFTPETPAACRIPLNI